MSHSRALTRKIKPKVVKRVSNVVGLLLSSGKRSKGWLLIDKIAQEDPPLAEAMFKENALLDALCTIVFSGGASDEDISKSLMLCSRFFHSDCWTRFGPQGLIRIIELPAFAALTKDLAADTFAYDNLLVAIHTLSVSDNNKPILGVQSMVKFLFGFLRDKSVCSRYVELAAAALLELSFHADVKQLLKDPALEAHDTLCELMEKSTGAAKHNATQLLWAVQDRRGSTATLQQQHIMISYSWAHQARVVKVARALQREGYPVWIDIDQMKGSTAEAMAEAVEHAAVVVICLSTAYKESANCRLEADYALKLRKPLVFLQMQKEFLPSGWLGMMLGTQLYYSFVDDAPVELQRSLSQLKKELESRGIGRIGAASVVTRDAQLIAVQPAAAAASMAGGHAGSPRVGSQAEVRALGGMSVDDVCAWCERAGLHDAVAAVRKGGLDGRALHQLLRCADLHTVPALAALQTAIGFPNPGVTLRFVYELTAGFVL